MSQCNDFNISSIIIIYTSSLEMSRQCLQHRYLSMPTERVHKSSQSFTSLANLNLYSGLSHQLHFVQCYGHFDLPSARDDLLMLKPWWMLCRTEDQQCCQGCGAEQEEFQLSVEHYFDMGNILKVFDSTSLIKLYTYFSAASNSNCNYLQPSPEIECTLLALPLAVPFAAPSLRPTLLSEAFAADLPAGELFLEFI